MAQLLSLELCEEVAYAGKRIVLFKYVEWPSIPPEKAWINFGISKEGEHSGISAYVRAVAWESNGGVVIESYIENCRDEYDDLVESAKRDGFREYGNWIVDDLN